MSKKVAKKAAPKKAAPKKVAKKTAPKKKVAKKAKKWSIMFEYYALSLSNNKCFKSQNTFHSFINFNLTSFARLINKIYLN